MDSVHYEGGCRGEEDVAGERELVEMPKRWKWRSGSNCEHIFLQLSGKEKKAHIDLPIIRINGESCHCCKYPVSFLSRFLCSCGIEAL